MMLCHRTPPLSPLRSLIMRFIIRALGTELLIESIALFEPVSVLFTVRVLDREIFHSSPSHMSPDRTHYIFCWYACGGS